MAIDKNSGNSAAAGGSMVGRMAKSKATRAITAQQVAKLSGENHYAYVKIGQCRRALEAIQTRILEGGTATGELVQACAELEANIGVAMFA